MSVLLVESMHIGAVPTDMISAKVYYLSVGINTSVTMLQSKNSKVQVPLVQRGQSCRCLIYMSGIGIINKFFNRYYSSSLVIILTNLK